MARGPSKKFWYDRVPRDKEQLKSFNELQYLEVLRKASARQHPEDSASMKLGGVAKALGVPTRKLKQFMQVPEGFTKEMAEKYAEIIKVPAKVLNRVGRSLFREGGTPDEKSPCARGKNDAKPEDTPKVNGRKPIETDFGALKEKAREDERKRNNPYDKGPIDLTQVKKITFVSYLDFTHLAVCHLETDGTLKISFLPDHIEEVNKNPWTQEVILGETVPVIQAVPHGRKQVQLTETHVPTRKRS